MAKPLTATQNAILGQHSNAGDRIAYYTQLAEWGYSYPGLALGVVNNDTSAGATANFFFLNYASAHQGINVSNATLAEVGIALMRGDFAARQSSSLSTQGKDLTYDLVQAFHTSVFGTVGVSGNAWTPGQALDALGSSEEKQALWETLLSSSDIWSFIELVDAANNLEYFWELVNAGMTATLFATSNDFGNYDVVLSGGGHVIGDDQFDDLTVGTQNDDVVMGFWGEDTLRGLQGDDRLYGSSGQDVLVGNAGSDIAEAGDDADILVGGDYSGSSDLSSLDLTEDHTEWNDGSGDLLKGGAGEDHYLISSTIGDTWDWAFLYQFDATKAAALLAVIDTIDESRGPADGLGTIRLQLENPAADPEDQFRELSVAGNYSYSHTNESGIDFFSGDGMMVAIYDYLEPTGELLPYLFVMGGYPLSPLLAIRGFYKGDFGINISSPSLRSTEDIYERTRPNDGDNVIAGAEGAQYHEGKGGNDTVNYASSAAAVGANLADRHGSGGDAEGDTLSSIENIIGSAHNDEISGDAGDNSLSGGDGDDILAGGSGNNILDGGAGTDTAKFSRLRKDYLIVAGDDGAILVSNGTGVDSVSNTESFEFSDGVVSAANILATVSGQTVGTSGDDTLTGTSNNDIVFGQAGADVVFGLEGDDRVYGGDGDDVIFPGAGSNTVDGGAGSDTVIINGRRSDFNVSVVRGTIVVEGNGIKNLITNSEWLVFDAPNDDADVSINLTQLIADDVATALNGTSSADSLTGTSGKDQIFGLGGDDQIFGLEGNDILSGGDGDDVLFPGLGNNFVDGGAGIDTVIITGQADDFAMSVAGETSIRVQGTDIENLISHAEWIVFDAPEGENDVSINVADFLLHNAPQTIVGTSGDDVLFGGAGNDTISGLAGDDVIFPGLGNDVIDGGDGSDTIIFTGRGSDFTVSVIDNDTVKVEGEGVVTLISNGEWIVFDAPEGEADQSIDVVDFIEQNGSQQEAGNSFFAVATSQETLSVVVDQPKRAAHTEPSAFNSPLSTWPVPISDLDNGDESGFAKIAAAGEDNVSSASADIISLQDFVAGLQDDNYAAELWFEPEPIGLLV